MNLAKQSDGKSWKSSNAEYLLSAADGSTLTVSITNSTGTKSYSFSCDDQLQANYQLNICGTYSAKSGITLTGSITGALWAGERNINFSFDENGSSKDPDSNPNDNTIPDAGSLYHVMGKLIVKLQSDGTYTADQLKAATLAFTSAKYVSGHGYAAPFDGALPANMNAILLNGTDSYYTNLYTFWTGKVKMSGTSLIATADLATADGAAPGNGAILLRYPYAMVNFNIIGAYGEATATQPYLDAKFTFSVESSLAKALNVKWQSVPQSSGVSAFQSPWILNESTNSFSWGSTENLTVYGLAVTTANKESIATNGAYYKEGQTLFTLMGKSGPYNGKTYDIVVPAWCCLPVWLPLAGTKTLPVQTTVNRCRLV